MPRRQSVIKLFIRATIVMAVVWLSLFIWAEVSLSQIGNHNGHSKWHHWYKSQKQAGGASCCNDKDCRPVAKWKFTKERDVVLWIDGEWVKPPQDRIQWKQTPDDGPTCLL